MSYLIPSFRPHMFVCLALVTVSCSLPCAAQTLVLQDANTGNTIVSYPLVSSEPICIRNLIGGASTLALRRANGTVYVIPLQGTAVAAPGSRVLTVTPLAQQGFPGDGWCPVAPTVTAANKAANETPRFLQRLTAFVGAPPPVAYLPDNGGDVVLTWSAADARQCVADATPYTSQWSGNMPLSGRVSVSIEGLGTHLFTLTCYPESGSDTVTSVATAVVGAPRKHL